MSVVITILLLFTSSVCMFFSLTYYGLNFLVSIVSICTVCPDTCKNEITTSATCESDRWVSNVQTTVASLPVLTCAHKVNGLFLKSFFILLKFKKERGKLTIFILTIRTDRN